MEPITDDTPKDKSPNRKALSKMKGRLKTQYGTYSGIIDENGKPVDNPTEEQTIKTMAKYMQNNKSDQSDNRSNVYRPKYSHLTMVYNKMKNATNA